MQPCKTMQDPYTKPSFIRNHARPFAIDLQVNQPLCYKLKRLTNTYAKVTDLSI